MSEKSGWFSSGGSAAQSCSLDIPGVVGGSAAYVGFTGGTCGLTGANRDSEHSQLDVFHQLDRPRGPNEPHGVGAFQQSGSCDLGRSLQQRKRISDRTQDGG
jgi:hypothetical protein